MFRKIKLADGTVIEVSKSAALPAGAVEMPDESDALDTAIAKAVAAAVAPLQEQLAKTKATSNTSGMPGVDVSSAQAVTVGKEVAEGTGINLVRMAKAKAVGALENRPAHEVAKSWGYATVAKALNTGVGAEGGLLVHQQFAAEFIGLLRNVSVVRAAGARQIPMPNGNLTWDRQLSSATAYYGAENTSITVSEPTVGQFSMSEKKLTALVPLTNDLIRNSSIGAEEFVRDDMLQVMALREDLAFLRGDGTSNTPTGIRNRIHADHVYDELAAVEGAATFAEVKAEAAKAKRKLKQARIPMTKCVWFAPIRAEGYLEALVGAGGDGTNQLEAELSAGKFRGYPIVFTAQLPENLGTGTNDSEMLLVDMDQVIIGDSMALELEVFPNATFNNGGTIVSGVSNDLTVIRAITKHDINMRHTTGGVVITRHSWGQ